MDHGIDVYALQDANGRSRCIGTAPSFGAARKMQEASLPDDLKGAYAGIQDGYPIFYTEFLTPELRAKYPQIGKGQDD